MVVEHTFVTTLEAPDALRSVSSMLHDLGFVADAQNAFTVEQSWNAVELRRGNAKSRRGKGILQWPQQVRVEWDRGRVDVAVAVHPPPRGRLDSNVTKISKKQNALVEQWLMALAQSIELLLAQQLPPSQAQANLVLLEQDLNEQARRSKRTSMIVLTLVLVFFVGCIFLLTYTIAHSRR